VPALLAYFFIGRMEVTTASLVTGLCSAVIPVACLFLVESLAMFFVLKTVLSVSVCLLVLWHLVRTHGYKGLWSSSLRDAEDKEFLVYASARVPGAFLVAAILSLPVTVASHTHPDLKNAAALSIAVALVSVVAAGVTPLSNIYLPQAAFLKAREQANSLRPWVVKVCWGIGVSAVLYVVVLGHFLEPFLQLLLGEDFLGSQAIIRAALPAAIPYVYFRCFQGLLDGAQAKPLTTYNALGSVLVLMACAWASWYWQVGEPAIVGLFGACTALGVLTLSQTFWLLRGRPQEERSDR